MTSSMPRRGSREAPSFDPEKPRYLKDYFAELEHLFTECAITQDAEKKHFAVYYLAYDLKPIWESLDEYSDATKTYDDFKKAVLTSYLDSSQEQYTLADLDLLIGNCQRVGINSLADLVNYQQQFKAITKYLKLKNRISDLEIQKLFIRGFQPALWMKISQRLQLKKPDHYPEDPYEMKDVQDAAKFVLHGTPTMLTSSARSSLPSSTSPLPPDNSIKPEALSSIFSEFTKTLLEAFNNQNRPKSQGQQNHSHNGTVKCAFCGKDHFIRDCKLVEEYQQAGKVKRNNEGKVVLPTGAFVPREIPGNFLKERIDEWHRRNPNQLASGMMSASTMLGSITQNAPTSTPVTPLPASNQIQQTYQLSTEDRMALLEAELFNLRAKHSNFKPIIRTRAQRVRDNSTRDDDDDIPAPPEPSKPSESTHVQPQNAPAQIPSSSQSSTSSSSSSIPEHPFREAQDASYLPPQSRNVGAPVKSTAKKSEPAYRTHPPIYDSEVAIKIYNRSLDAPVTLTQRELLSIAPEVRSHYREATTTKRNANSANLTPAAQTNILEDEGPSDRDFNRSHSMPLAASIHRSPPEGSTIIQDPIEMYFRSLGPGENPDPNRIIVAKESSALRSVFAIVDNSQKVECILDPGCQIVAMSEEVCHDLSLVYDPTIKLNMQSANGTVDQSLGLARHVPFLIGGLTFYMQVHIIRSPAYDILLGRPFDILTRSIVQNFANEDQTITIFDPNTSRTVTVPTIPRSPPQIRKSNHGNFIFSRV